MDAVLTFRKSVQFKNQHESPLCWNLPLSCFFVFFRRLLIYRCSVISACMCACVIAGLRSFGARFKFMTPTLPMNHRHAQMGQFPPAAIQRTKHTQRRQFPKVVTLFLSTMSFLGNQCLPCEPLTTVEEQKTNAPWNKCMCRLWNNSKTKKIKRKLHLMHFLHVTDNWPV